VVGIDEETDVAVIKIKAGHDLPTVKLGDSSSAAGRRLGVGHWITVWSGPDGNRGNHLDKGQAVACV